MPSGPGIDCPLDGTRSWLVFRTSGCSGEPDSPTEGKFDFSVVKNRLFRRWTGRAHGFASSRPSAAAAGACATRRSAAVYAVTPSGSSPSTQGTSDFVRNIEARPEVRVRVHGTWRDGHATVMYDENARRRLLKLNPINSAFLAIAAR